jgi:hypothetical protein
MNILHAEEHPGPRIVLVPSPLVGPYSWSLVQGELAERGWETLVSVDLRDPLGRQPCWQRTVGGVQGAVHDVPDGAPIVLVGHSNAGPLLPAAGAAVRLPISAYLFVDSRLSHPGTSRLDAIASEDAASAAELRAALGAGLRFPAWTDDDLRPIVPDPDRRRSLLEELRPRGREYWTEELPGISGWPNAPCAYLQFSSVCQSAADRARRAGWPTRYIAAGHFHQLVDPSEVADALVELLAACGIHAPRRQTATMRKEANT